MKNVYLIPLMGILIVSTFIANSCTNEDDTVETSNVKNSTFESFYNELVALPSLSVFDVSGNNTRGNSVGFPSITNEDLDYLSSLNQNEFENLRDSLISEAGGIEVIDSLQVSNYMSLYLNITNQGSEPQKMQKLKDFCINYLLEPEEVSLLTRSTDVELSTSELEIYAQQAAYIDRVSRPIYEHIYEESLKIAIDKERKGDKVECMMELGFKLALAGLDIGVGAFLDAMTDGIGTEGLILECIKIGVDATSMWMDYEICNGRWH